MQPKCIDPLNDGGKWQGEVVFADGNVFDSGGVVPAIHFGSKPAAVDAQKSQHISPTTQPPPLSITR